MSRSGYFDDDDGRLVLYRQAVENAIHGKRGQSFLRELATALDSMPNKRLISGELQDADGEVCALGCIGARRGLSMATDAEDLYADPYEEDLWEGLGEVFGIAESMAREIMFINDDGTWQPETPEKRWERVRRWVSQNIITQDVTP